MKRKTNKICKARTIDQWKELLNAIESEFVRKKVACIVWWDYCKKDWPDIRDFCPCSKYPLAVDEDTVRAELIKLGYFPDAAARRCQNTKNY